MYRISSFQSMYESLTVQPKNEVFQNEYFYNMILKLRVILYLLQDELLASFFVVCTRIIHDERINVRFFLYNEKRYTKRITNQDLQNEDQ